jgi:hypothetical protein
VPLVTALAIGVPAASSLLLAAAAICAFLANEPLLVILGHRGRRLQEQASARARPRFVMFASTGVATAAIGLALAPPATFLAAGIAAIPCTIVLVLAWRRGQHTLLGELVAAIAMPGLALPVAVANGSALGPALAMWAAWSIGFASTVIAVHRVIARHKAGATAVDAAALAGMIATAALLVLAPFPITIAVALVAVSALLVARPPKATYLRAIGVAITIVATACGAAALAFA